MQSLRQNYFLPDKTHVEEMRRKPESLLKDRREEEAAV